MRKSALDLATIYPGSPFEQERLESRTDGPSRNYIERSELPDSVCFGCLGKRIGLAGGRKG